MDASACLDASPDVDLERNIYLALLKARNRFSTPDAMPEALEIMTWLLFLLGVIRDIVLRRLIRLLAFGKSRSSQQK